LIFLRALKHRSFVYVQNFIVFIRQTTFHKKFKFLFSMDPPDPHKMLRPFVLCHSPPSACCNFFQLKLSTTWANFLNFKFCIEVQARTQTFLLAMNCGRKSFSLFLSSLRKHKVINNSAHNCRSLFVLLS
jgi:hypothetical protein